MNAQQLKISILQMAVQGKLVPQDPNDEPASVLLERIRKEKEKLIKEGKIKKEKNPSYIFRGEDNLPYEKIGKNEPVCIADEMPFEIPDSWEWCKLATITYHVGNKVNQILAKSVMPIGRIPVVSQSSELIDGYCNDDKKVIDNLPLVMFGDHTRNVKYIDFPFVIGADGTKFHKVLICDAKYIYYWMSYAAINLRNRGYARHYTLLVPMLIPIPPIEEQKRIVNIIESLIPLVEEYDNQERKIRELNNSFPNSLKKSILQQAVMGKLVPQDPNDEPASVLLEKIQAEKIALIKAGKLKIDKHESYIFRRGDSYYEKLGSVERCIDGEIPFEVPDSWSWCRLRYICHDMRYGTAKKSSKVGKVAVLRMGNIQHGEIDYTNLVYSNDDEDNKALELQMLDILFNRTNSRELVGKTAIYRGDIPAIYAGYLVLIRPILIDPEYLNYVMNSHYEWSFCQRVRSDGINQSNVSASKIGELLIPIPPLSEQKRIVEKLKDALEYCNYLAG